MAKVFKAVFKAVKAVVNAVASNIRTIGAIAAYAAGSFACGPAGAICGGFAAGLVASGGDLKAGVIGAATAWAFQGIGAQDIHFGFKAVANGVVGGVSSEAQGSNFLSGFASAGVAQLVGETIT